MRVTRRSAFRQLVALFGAAPFLGAQQERNPQATPSIPPHDPVMEPINVFDFAKLAKKKLDPVAWDYMSGGSEDEVSLHDNRAAFNHIILRPHALVDVHKIDLSLELFGIKLDYPIILDPAGGKNCFYPDGENTVCRAAGKAKALHITNGGIQKTLEAGLGPTAWFQLTTGGELRNRQTMRAFVKRLEAQGCKGICFTTDIMYVSHREREMRNKLERSWCETGLPKRDAQGRLPVAQHPWVAGIFPSRPFPTPTWDSVRELRSLTSLPILLKGILTAEDGALAVENGVSGVIVSNHGARQLDQVGATIEALPEVVRAVNGKIPVLVDGGFRRGTDILKGLAAFGQPGVERVIELLRTELALDMGLAGVPNLSSITRNLVRIRGAEG
jgi:4-hydroxymandelate oxidase